MIYQTSWSAVLAENLPLSSLWMNYRVTQNQQSYSGWFSAYWPRFTVNYSTILHKRKVLGEKHHFLSLRLIWIMKNRHKFGSHFIYWDPVLWRGSSLLCRCWCWRFFVVTEYFLRSQVTVQCSWIAHPSSRALVSQNRSVLPCSFDRKQEATATKTCIRRWRRNWGSDWEPSRCLRD